MKAFLRQVAEHWYAAGDLRRMCFIFPNKRSLAFFRKYLSEIVAERSDVPVEAPALITIKDFFYRVTGKSEGGASPGVVPVLFQGSPQARVPGRVHLLGRRAAVGFRRRGQIPRRPGAVVHEPLRVQGYARLLLLPHGDAACRPGTLFRAFPEGERPGRGREEGCQGQFPAGMEHPPAAVQDVQGGARCAPPGL